MVIPRWRRRNERFKRLAARKQEIYDRIEADERKFLRQNPTFIAYHPLFKDTPFALRGGARAGIEAWERMHQKTGEGGEGQYAQTYPVAVSIMEEWLIHPEVIAEFRVKGFTKRVVRELLDAGIRGRTAKDADIDWQRSPEFYWYWFREDATSRNRKSRDEA